MDKRFVAILVALIIIFGGIFFLTKDNNSTSNSKVSPSNHVIGEGQTGIRLVEYGDYQCPACESFNIVTDQVEAKYAKQIIFQFRNLPLPQLHPNAYAAAKAAEAAGLQNKYWQMHDALYKSSNWLVWTNAKDPTSAFENYARQIGLNIDQFRSDIKSQQVNDVINADVNEFKKTGQPQATPTYFLDGKVLDDSQLLDPTTQQPSVAQFSKFIDAAISAKKH